MSLPAFAAAGLVPILIAFGAAGLLGLGPWQGRFRPAEAAPALGFLAGFVALEGGLPFSGSLAQHQLAEAVLLVLAVALPVSLLRLSTRNRRLFAGGAALFALSWVLGWRNLPALPVPALVAAAGLAVAAMLIVWRLDVLAQAGILPVAVAGFAALALAGVAAIGHARGLAGLALAFALGIGGFAVWARPFTRTPLGLAALATLAAGLTALLAGYVHGALTPPWGLLLLVPAFFIDRLAARLPGVAPLKGRKSKAARLQAERRRIAVLTALAALPCVAVVALDAILAGKGLWH